MTDPETVPLPEEAQIQAARKTFEAGWNRLMGMIGVEYVVIEYDSRTGYMALFRRRHGRRIAVPGKTAEEAMWGAVAIAEAK